MWWEDVVVFLLRVDFLSALLSTKVCFLGPAGPGDAANGIHPSSVPDIPPQFIALMRTNLNVQDLTVQALLEENRDHIYHAAMLDPRAAAELDLDQIKALVDALLAAHGDWMPKWLQKEEAA